MIPNNARELFEIPDDIAYLNCSYMSPQLRPVREAGERALAQRSRPWEIPPAAFFEEVERGRDLFARLVGGDADGVAFIPSVSYGIAVAAANAPVEKGNSIVVLEGQFPSNVHPWRELAAERGATLVTVPRPPDHNWTDAVLAALGRGVAVVAVPNCHWTDGSLLDLVAIGRRAREVGAVFVVDAIQSLGAHPLDVAEARPDFLVATAYKWLLGPYGVGFMHVRDDRRDGRPIEHNWINRAGSEDFSDLTRYARDFQPGARRYDVGERSNFILLPMANEALRHILGWGVENISEATGKLTDLIEEKARKRGIQTVPKERRCRHMIGLGLGPDAPDDLAARLAAENVFVSVRGGSIRVSPHIYSDERDVGRFFKVLDRTLSGTYPA